MRPLLDTLHTEFHDFDPLPIIRGREQAPYPLYT